MNSKHLVAPSLLASDFGNLARDIKMINETNADWFHVDIMDGNFVPNISFGPAIVKTIKEHADKPLDVHLMIQNPDQYLKQFKEAGADVITIHAEATNHLHSVIAQIKDMGIKAGVALNPHTNVVTIEDVLEDVDLVLLMSVNPGFGGQKFIYNTLPKLNKLKRMLIERNLDPYVEVDGGIGLQNAEAILKAGANVLVAGSSVFKSKDPKKSVSLLKAIELNNFDL